MRKPKAANRKKLVAFALLICKADMSGTANPKSGEIRFDEIGLLHFFCESLRWRVSQKPMGLRISAADDIKQFIGQEYRGRQALCARVQGMQYPCAGQGRQPCPVKWRSPLRTGYYLSQNAARMAASLPLSPVGKI